MTDLPDQPDGEPAGTILQIGGAGHSMGWGINAIEVRESTGGACWKWRSITAVENQWLIDALNAKMVPPARDNADRACLDQTYCKTPDCECPVRDGAEGATVEVPHEDCLNCRCAPDERCAGYRTAPPKPAPDAMRTVKSLKITICGSARFADEIDLTNRRLSMQGHIVYSIVPLVGAITADQKEMLRKIHRAKIEASDAIYVVALGGYIGPDVAAEIAYAKAAGKVVLDIDEHGDAAAYDPAPVPSPDGAPMFQCPDCEGDIAGDGHKAGCPRSPTPAVAAEPAEPVALGKYIPDIVKNAMLTMWNEICADTDCHPLDITHGTGKILWFTPHHWAEMTGAMVAQNIADLYATPPVRGDREADRYFDMAGEFGNRIQRAVDVININIGSINRSVAAELKRVLDPENALSRQAPHSSSEMES